jgi:hypothetical protein
VAALIRSFEDRLVEPDARPEGSRLVEMVAWGAAVEVTP